MAQRRKANRSMLRVAIVGAGRMALHHARALRQLWPGVSLVAVADPDASARERIHAIWPDAVTFGTLEEAVSAMPLDVVHVCTPPETHEAIAALALRSGCHTYVEKPFAAKKSAARELIALAGAKNLKLCAGHQLLYEAPARKALELVPAIGRVCHVESFFSFRQVRSLPGGGPPLPADRQLFDILPHPVYLLLHFLEASGADEDVRLCGMEVGPGATVHALVRAGGISGTLTVTLEGRPIESYVRLVGSNGLVHADFVGGATQRLIGSGASGIRKVLNPFRMSGQLFTGTAAALAFRALRRNRSYPGLAEILGEFYQAIRGDSPSPVSERNILQTVQVCEEIDRELRAYGRGRSRASLPGEEPPRVLVTGGTGFLGREIVRALASAGTPVRVVARRVPPAWEQVDGAEYTACDLATMEDAPLMHGIETVVHCAAETAGGWEAHGRNSIEATRRLVEAAAGAGVQRMLHVSSLAVVGTNGGDPTLSEESPLEARPEACGPYVWGKLQSEVLARQLASRYALPLKIVRPGALVAPARLDPPGRLGRRLGNVFLAVGRPRDRIAVIDVELAGRLIAWLASHFGQAPEVIHVLPPDLPTKGELVSRLKHENPTLWALWLPMSVLPVASLAARGLLKILHPRRRAPDIAKIFIQREYDLSRVRDVLRAMGVLEKGSALPNGSGVAPQTTNPHAEVPALSG